MTWQFGPWAPTAWSKGEEGDDDVSGIIHSEGLLSADEGSDAAEGKALLVTQAPSETAMSSETYINFVKSAHGLTWGGQFHLGSAQFCPVFPTQL